MDIHSMKRKQLQALCKKHKIPVNLTNMEMAIGLLLFKGTSLAGCRLMEALFVSSPVSSDLDRVSLIEEEYITFK
jgi:hypothetical protein